MRDRPGVALMAPRPTLWPPDDTEESVLGTDLHQTSITNLRSGINEAAASQAPLGGEAPWRAGGQTLYRGFRRPDGSAYQTLPDVFVCRGGPFNILRPSRSLAVDGPPLLIIEVLSPNTYEQDLDMGAGKGYSYALAGVQEYLQLDPAGEYLPDQGQGWRLEDGVYRPWRADGRGQWRSRMIGVAIGLEGVQVIVATWDGERLLREGENAPERLRLRRRLAEQEFRRLEDLAAKEAELTAKEQQRLAELAAKDAELAAKEQQRLADLAAKDAELAAKERELQALRQRLAALGNEPE